MSNPADINQLYRPMACPLPAPGHANYPLYTPGGQDKRWLGTGELEEGGMQWVGGLMCVHRGLILQSSLHF